MMNVDLKELKRDKERNFQERLKFIDMYVEWLRRTPNKVWAKVHGEFVDSVFERDGEGE